MDLEILCEVDIPEQDAAELGIAAERLGQTVEQVIRSAVKSFAAECVPTQNAAGTAACDS